MTAVRLFYETFVIVMMQQMTSDMQITGGKDVCQPWPITLNLSHKLKSRNTDSVSDVEDLSWSTKVGE